MQAGTGTEFLPFPCCYHWKMSMKAKTVGAHDGDEAEMQMPSCCDGCGPCQWSGSLTLLCGRQASRSRTSSLASGPPGCFIRRALGWESPSRRTRCSVAVMGFRCAWARGARGRREERPVVARAGRWRRRRAMARSRARQLRLRPRAGTAHVLRLRVGEACVAAL